MTFRVSLGPDLVVFASLYLTRRTLGILLFGAGSFRFLLRNLFFPRVEDLVK